MDPAAGISLPRFTAQANNFNSYTTKTTHVLSKSASKSHIRNIQPGYQNFEEQRFKLVLTICLALKTF